MTKLQNSQTGGVDRPHELRLHPRRKLSGMAYVELTQDNGGILLNLSEGGFAIQSALVLSSTEFPDLRFQLPNMRGWLTGSGRVAWLSESKKEAGIQFLDLHEHARAQVRMWVGKDGLDEPETPASTSGNGAPAGVNPEISRGSEANASQTFWGSRSLGAERATVQNYAAAPVRHREPAPAEDDRGFRFNDYSMFAADATGSVTWAEPIRQKRGWGSYVLFTILLAALFFVLGAIIGRDNLNGLVSSSVDGWKRIQGDATPSTKPPAPPPSATESSTPPIGGGQSTAASGTPSANGNDTVSGATQGAASNGTSAPPTQPGNGANAAAPLSSATVEPQSQATTAKDEAASVPQQSSVGNAGSNAAAASNNSPVSPAAKTSADSRVSKARERNPFPTKTGTPGAETSDSNPDAFGSTESGRSILVTAPAPGSPPFFVHLPGEPVSASSSVAISARRSIQVPPRAYDGGYGTQRMIVGKLLAHSDPFYLVDARAKHIEGIVELHALVGRSGEVLRVTPVSGPGVLVTAGVTALREWRYEPTFINGDPVETQVDVTMVFSSR